MSPAGEAVVGLLVALGAVVVLPVGLQLLGPQVVPAPRSAAWPLAGAAAVVSLLLPHSRLAVVLTLPFVLASAVLLGAGVRLTVRTLRDVAPPARPGRAHAVVPGDRAGGLAPRVNLAVRVATMTALVLPAVGASALVAERAEWGLLGFSGTYLALTVPHMLYAGFGAALVAGAVARLAPGDRLATAGAWGVRPGRRSSSSGTSWATSPSSSGRSSSRSRCGRRRPRSCGRSRAPADGRPRPGRCSARRPSS